MTTLSWSSCLAIGRVCEIFESGSGESQCFAAGRCERVQGAIGFQPSVAAYAEQGATYRSGIHCGFGRDTFTELSCVERGVGHEVEYPNQRESRCERVEFSRGRGAVESDFLSGHLACAAGAVVFKAVATAVARAPADPRP